MQGLNVAESRRTVTLDAVLQLPLRYVTLHGSVSDE